MPSPANPKASALYTLRIADACNKSGQTGPPPDSARSSRSVSTASRGPGKPSIGAQRGLSDPSWPVRSRSWTSSLQMPSSSAASSGLYASRSTISRGEARRGRARTPPARTASDHVDALSGPNVRTALPDTGLAAWCRSKSRRSPLVAEDPSTGGARCRAEPVPVRASSAGPLPRGRRGPGRTRSAPRRNR